MLRSVGCDGTAAFPISQLVPISGSTSVIQVSLRAADEVVVSVADNGVGVGGSQEEGIGSRITALLAQQLGGTIARDNLGSGSSVTLRMPRPRES
jgi:two-component sensor histidine kinase